MPKKGEAYNTPAKRFSCPPDVSVLQNYANHIANGIRNYVHARVRDADRLIGSGRGTPSIRNKREE